MTEPVHWIVPGSIEQVTGGYLYDRRIVEGLRVLGRRVAVHELPGTYPMIDEETVRAAEKALAGLPEGAAAVIDGLALPGLAGRLPRESRRLRLVALVHHPLFLETGLGEAEARTLRRLEQGCLALVRRVLCTSPHTVAVLAEMGVAKDRIGVVVPGTDRVPDPVPAEAGEGDRKGPTRLLTVATLTARKGHLVLIEALASLAGLDWHLTCAGSTTRDPAVASAVRAAIARHGLENRVDLVGEMPPGTLGSLYRSADVFVLPSFYEGYGMALAEALAHGLPVVSTDAGAIPSTVPGGAGILVPPGDARALADALHRLLAGKEEMARLREGARRAARDLPDWSRQASRFLEELRLAG
jgi:glycosyltransferase involved in cell wall biosynthesis